QYALGERQLDGGVALGDQRDPLDRLDQGGPVDPCHGRVLGGEQRADLGELAVQEPGGGPSYAAAGGALEADDALARAGGGERDRHLGAGGQGLGGVGEYLGR